jgi:Putative metal-binding motif
MASTTFGLLRPEYLLILVSGLVVSACAHKPAGGDQPDASMACENEEDCPTGWTCQGNLCVLLTSDDAGVDASLPGELTIFPDPVQFGNAPLHLDTVRDVTLANIGDGNITVTQIVLTEDDLLDEYTCLPDGVVEIVIPPAGTETVTVRLHPNDAELDLGSLSIHSDDPVNPVLTVQLESSYKGVPTLDVCVLDDDVTNPQPFADCDVDSVGGDPLLDYGVVTFNVPVMRPVVIRNAADGNAPLHIENVEIHSDSIAIEADMSLRLFMYDTDGVTEIAVTPPLFLSAGDPATSIPPELLYAEVTFGASVDGIVTNTWILVTSNDLNGKSVPISAAVSGCPENLWDLNNDPSDGCEYSCVYSGPELCGNAEDENCNGATDDEGAISCVTYYKDADGDNYGVTADWRCLCSPSTTDDYTATQNNDCNDNNDLVNPLASESCDGVDNNCNNQTDEGLGQTACGLGECLHTIDNCAGGVIQICDPLEGQSTEVCDLSDNDCDGLVDETLGQTTCGLGECVHTIDNCISGVVQNCNPFDGTSSEECNGLDDDCDGTPDSDAPATMCGNLPNATEGCGGASGCFIAGCSSSWYDLDGTVSNGCECHASPSPVSTGNTCANAISLGSLTDTSGSTVTRSGNTPVSGREVWYVFTAVDDVDTLGDEFHVDVRFTEAPNPNYVMDVYRGGCPGTGTQVANAENDRFDWYVDFNRTSTGCTQSAPCGEGNCRASNVANYNICNDDTATFLVRVRQPSSQTLCTSYTLEISNGVY